MRLGWLVGPILAALCWNAAAAQSPPMRVYGSAFIAGQAAPPGTVVQALVGNAVCGTGVVGVGARYDVDVYAAPSVPCGTGGALVLFTVGGQPARETTPLQPGAFVPLDLSVGVVGVVVPPPLLLPAFEAVSLVPRCNNIVSTWPVTTPITVVAAAVTPPEALISLWRYDAPAARFRGFAPEAPEASDLAVVDRLEPLFICVWAPATLLRPAA